MAKKLFALLLGFALAPAFISAENSIVGSECLVRVYHVNFAFPPEGGRIVQIGQEMFFWKSYRPECLNELPTNQSVVVTNYGGTGASNVLPAEYGLSGSLGNQIAGDPCAVRVYHVNFRFPPEGGKIVKLGDELFFIKTYKPGCANAGAAGVVLATSSSNFNPLQSDPVPNQVYVNPAITTSSQLVTNNTQLNRTYAPGCYY